MTSLKSTTDLVKTILEEDTQARNSDSFLYLKVLERQAEAMEFPISLQSMSVSYFLLHGQEKGFSGFETVRRSRQKIQQHRPDLAACKKVEEMRSVNEAEFRKYARSGI